VHHLVSENLAFETVDEKKSNNSNNDHTNTVALNQNTSTDNHQKSQEQLTTAI
jgi:hypothetical protein